MSRRRGGRGHSAGGDSSDAQRSDRQPPGGCIGRETAGLPGGAKIPVPAEKLFTSPQQKAELSEGTLGRRLASEGTRVEISFHPRRAQLSDDPEAGIFRGNITSIIYKGDHYSYQVTDEYQEEYTVDDEYLWNEGDFVSVIVPEDAMEFKLLDARGKGGDKG